LLQKNSNKKNKLKSSSFADYDMVQAETRWIRNTDKYAKQNTVVTVFNILVEEWDQSYFKTLEKVKPSL
jgi:hypothetical protein